MRGLYRVYSEGKLIAEAPNMITDQGARTILRYFAKEIDTIGGAVAVGTSHVQSARTDTRLGFEFSRSAVDLTGVQYLYNQVIYKAPMEMAASGLIYELGLYPYMQATPTDFSSLIITGFEPELETLTGGTVNTTNYRVGFSSYTATATANTTSAVTRSAMRLDLSGYSDSDIFSLGYFTNDANTATIRVRFYTDAGNYYTYSFTPSTVQNYYVKDFAKSLFVATGSPRWDSITSAEFAVTAGAGGTTSVQFDGLRVNAADAYADYSLVSRSILASPIVKRLNQQMDIEYVLEFNV